MYRLSPHVRISSQDTFTQTSNVFDQAAGGVSGSTQSSTEAVVAPFAEQRNNLTSVELTYQFSRNGMIGAGGTYSIVNYPNPAQAAGLSNSNSYGGSAFYNRRLSSKQYVGANYQYSNMKSNSPTGDSGTQVDTIYSFYTVYFGPSLSISVSGGPQHFSVTEGTLPSSGSWTPAVTSSMGWQRRNTNFAVNYSRTVTGAGGLFGAFHSNNAGASARWQLKRTWTVGSSVSYSIEKSVTQLSSTPSQGGHSISGTVSVQHLIRERFSTEVGYSRIHQGFGGVAAVSANPDGDHAYISISYELTRPLGR
jgi:hypothetical protein